MTIITLNLLFRLHVVCFLSEGSTNSWDGFGETIPHLKELEVGSRGNSQRPQRHRKRKRVFNSEAQQTRNNTKKNQ